jgi:pheromone shutdown protein TraB
MITLIGVAHVFDISKSLENAIIKRNPAVVCVELDAARYQALYSRDSNREAPFVYKMLAGLQENIAKKYGAQVGSEMLTAIETAKTLNAKLAFIDMDASKIVSNFWRTMTFSERVKFLFALFSSLFMKELKRFEENDQFYLESFGKEFPTAKRVLIDDRNIYMAKAIKKINEKHENIVAVIGDGHVEGIRRLLDPVDVEIIRLSQLRAETQGSVDEVTISYEISYDSHE